MEERRKHPQECLRQEEWGEIKEFVKNTDAYRAGLCSKLDDIRKENKERFEILLAQLRSDRADRDVAIEQVNSRISVLKTTAGQIIFWGVCSLVTFATAWGALSTTVVRNTGIIHELESFHKKVAADGEQYKMGM